MLAPVSVVLFFFAVAMAVFVVDIIAFSHTSIPVFVVAVFIDIIAFAYMLIPVFIMVVVVVLLDDAGTCLLSGSPT